METFHFSFANAKKKKLLCIHKKIFFRSARFVGKKNNLKMYISTFIYTLPTAFWSFFHLMLKLSACFYCFIFHIILTNTQFFFSLHFLWNKKKNLHQPLYPFLILLLLLISFVLFRRDEKRKEMKKRVKSWEIDGKSLKNIFKLFGGRSQSWSF